MNRDAMLILSGMGLGVMMASKQGKEAITSAIKTFVPALAGGSEEEGGGKGQEKGKDKDDDFSNKHREKQED